MKINRIYYEDYDFLNKKASEGRNAIHDYPAMFHYMLVSDLLKIYGENCNVVYDPFCGSGVTIVESLKQGKTAIGTDINPLALLISKVRASNIEHEHLEKIISLFRCNLLKLKLDIPKHCCPIKSRINTTG